MAPRFTINQTCDSFTHNITISNIDVNGYDAFSMFGRIEDVLKARNGKIQLHDVFRILNVSLYVPEPLERMTENWMFTEDSKMKIYSDKILISGMVDHVDARTSDKKFKMLMNNNKPYYNEREILNMLQDKEYYADNKPYHSCKNSYVVRDATIDKVIFHDPATIVYWKDGTKTVVKCGPNDTYSKETGLALCYMKKVLGNKGNYNNVFRKWIKEEDHG